MSKMDDLRAMREARYAAAKAPAPTAARAKPEAAPTTEGLCGHRSMNGRSCTRESGHSAASHRYA